jgi:hypothetical protein
MSETTNTVTPAATETEPKEAQAICLEPNAVRSRRRKIQRQVVAGNLASVYVMTKTTVREKGRFASKVAYHLAGQRGNRVTFYGPEFPKFHDMRVWADTHDIPMPLELTLPTTKKKNAKKPTAKPDQPAAA